MEIGQLAWQPLVDFFDNTWPLAYYDVLHRTLCTSSSVSITQLLPRHHFQILCKNRAKMKQVDFIERSLPADVALKIASLLQVRDLCALGCCSRFWRELCGSDCIWESLARERWPFLACFDFTDFSSSSSSTSANDSNFREWKKLYIKRHNELATRSTVVAKFVEDCSSSGSLEVGDYLKAIEDLGAMKFGLKDIQMFLFKPKLNVLLNLVGLHYCLTWLGIPGDSLIEALQTGEISERHVCIQWWKIGRWFYGFCMRDEAHCRWVSLADLATDDEEHVLGVLHRGAIHVLRVKISAVDPRTNPWSCQVTQRQR